MLRGSHLVVLGLGQDAQIPKRFVQILHVSGNTGLDGTVVVVVQFLTAGGLGAEQGAAGGTQVFALVVQLLVHQEVLLLGTNLSDDALALVVAEETQQTQSLTTHFVHGTQQGGFLIQGVAGIGAEDGGNAQGTLLDKCERGGVPCGIAAGLKGGTQTAGGEGGGIGLAAHQFLSGEFHHDSAAGDGGDEAVVLLGGDAGHGLEPMCIVSGTLLGCPLFHGFCNFICGGKIQRGSLGHAFLPCAVGSGGKAVLHGFFVENHAAEAFGKFCSGTHNLYHLPKVLPYIVSVKRVKLNRKTP